MELNAFLIFSLYLAFIWAAMTILRNERENFRLVKCQDCGQRMKRRKMNRYRVWRCTNSICRWN
jgi:hypothetical protein